MKREELLAKKDDILDYDAIKEKFPWIFEKNREFVLSPDADGFYCGILLTAFLGWKCVGFYDDKNLALKKGCETNDVVFVDVEMFDQNKKSIGNHALLPSNPKKYKESIDIGFSQCINLNLVRRISHKEYQSKYPFGTSHLLLSILSYELKDTGELSEFLNTPEKVIVFGHADGMFKNMGAYPENSKDWLRFLRVKEQWNPLKSLLSITKEEELEARAKFYAKRNKFSKKHQRGDKLVLKTQRGNDEAIFRQEDGTWAIKEDNRSRTIGFIKMVCDILSVEFKEKLWDCWDDLSLTEYEKKHAKTTNKCFEEMLMDNTVSYAFTKTDALEYSVETKKPRNGWRITFDWDL